MQKVNITKITFICINCPHCNKSFKVFIEGCWNDIKEMKISTDKRLMFACPYCDDVLIDETDFSSICSDEDEDMKILNDMKERILDLWKNENTKELYKRTTHKYEYDDYSKYYKRINDNK